MRSASSATSSKWAPTFQTTRAASTAWCACGPTPRRPRSSCPPTWRASSRRTTASASNWTNPTATTSSTPRPARLVLVLPRRPPRGGRRAIDFEQALEFEFVSLSADTSLAQRLQGVAETLGRRMRLRIRVRSFDAMCQMVAAGLGVAVLPATAVQPYLQSMGLEQVAIQGDWVHRQLLIGAKDFNAVARP